jgi:cyclophilin family peptidyl-prolyl cis-trans isomerase
VPSNKRARQRAGRATRMAELRSQQRRRRRNRRTLPIVGVIVAVVAVIIVVTGLSGGGSNKDKASTASSTTVTTTIVSTTKCPNFDGSSTRTLSFSTPPPNCLTAGKAYSATFYTNEGNVAVSFDTTKTPNTSNNFIVLALYHYYDQTRLFRTDTSIGIIQGGSPHTESAEDPGPGYTIKDEGSGYTYAPGDLVMARGTGANSAAAQFFFCVTSACSNLNSQGTYVVFAHVTSGLPVLQKILGMNVNENNGLGGAPSSPVTISKITVTES